MPTYRVWRLFGEEWREEEPRDLDYPYLHAQLSNHGDRYRAWEVGSDELHEFTGTGQGFLTSIARAWLAERGIDLPPEPPPKPRHEFVADDWRFDYPQCEICGQEVDECVRDQMNAPAADRDDGKIMNAWRDHRCHTRDQAEKEDDRYAPAITEFGKLTCSDASGSRPLPFCPYCGKDMSK